MSLKRAIVLLCGALCWPGLAQNADPPWSAELNAARTAFSAGKYPVAVEQYRQALKKAEEASAPQAVLIPILKLLASALRTNADPAGAQQILERVLALMKESSEVTNADTARVMSELALVQRAQDLRAEAVTTLKTALVMRKNAPMSAEVAQDATLLAVVQHEMGEDQKAASSFEMAIALWGALPDSGLQVLTAIDPLASIYRNSNDYKRAEELYTWALRLREAALGPKDAELISTLDSLAYVLFGLKKYDEAEVIYTRLLALWEMVGGPEHPMLALVLDKMAEFYLEQKRYDTAEPIIQRAQTIRSKATLQTMHRAGRVLAGQKRPVEAIELYGRALRIAAEARIADEEIPGMLTAYSMLLRQQQRDKEASVIGKRFKDAMDRKAAQESKREVVSTAPQP